MPVRGYQAPRSQVSGYQVTTGNGIDYHGGPIVPSERVVSIYWSRSTIYSGGPVPGTSGSGAQDGSLVGFFLRNLGGSSYYNINTTYGDTVGVGHDVTNTLSYTGYWADSVHAPASGAAPTDSDIQNEIIRGFTSGVVSYDPSTVYVVFSGSGVNLGGGAFTQYCGYHGYFVWNNNVVLYSAMPYDYTPGCYVQTGTPNNDPPADTEVSVLAHEIEETNTDPRLNAWYDSKGNENADKCAWNFGTTFSAGGGVANISVGGKNFLIQRNWLNANGGSCAQGYLPAPAPPNDNIANATAITGNAGSITGTNAGATPQASEPPSSTIDGTNGPNKTVWYSWTAPNGGTATLDLCTNATYDTMLAVYTGSSLASLSRITDDDDTTGCGSGLQSKITFAAAPGGTYQIQVDGFGGTTGTFTLTWSLPVVDTIPPTVSNFAPTTASPTKATTITYTLTFSEPVTGLASGDFSIGATSSGWSVTGVSGAGAGPYTVAVTRASPTDDTVSLSLAALSVADLSSNAGPTSPATAATVTVDGTAPAATTPTLTPSTASAGAAVTVTATASDAIAVASAQISLAGGAWTAMSAADGAFGGPSEGLTTSIAAPGSGGTYGVCVRATDSAGNTSAGTTCATLTVTIGTKPVTILAYTGPTATTTGASVTLSATLKTGTGTALAGQIVGFTLNGVTSSATTNSSGVAALARTAPATAGSYPIGIAFAGDTTFAPSSTAATLVVKVATKLTYTGPTAAAPGAAITLSATLKTAAGTALSGKTVTFTLNGVTSGATTNSSGVASVARTAPTTTGSYAIAVAFAGDTSYGAATKSATLVVRVATKVTYTGPTVAAKGAVITLSATLKTAAGTALSGKTVTFKLNGKTFTATTNASGVASTATTAPTTAASYAISIAFAGDTTYAKASASATLQVS
jgi:hypothetical protein